MPRRRFQRLAALVFTAFTLMSFAAGAQSLLVRQGEISPAGTVSRVTTAALDNGRLVTALRNLAGSLEVTTWELVPAGTFTRLDTVVAGTAGAIQDVAVAALSPSRFVTATQQNDNSLLLTSWGVNSAGNITRLKTAAAGPISQVALAALDSGSIVTLTRGSTNLPKIIQWSLDGFGTFTRGVEASDSSVPSLDVAVTALSPNRIATAYVQTNQTLLVTTWSVTGRGVAKKDTLAGAQVTDAQIVTAASDRVITGSRRLNGNVQVAAWDVDPAGNLTAASSAETGPVVSLALAPLGTTRVATAVRQNDDTLKVIVWQVVDQVHQLDSVTGGPFLVPAAVNLGMDRLVTPVVLGGSTLKLIAWREASVGLLHVTTGPFGSAITAGLTAPGLKKNGGEAAEAEERAAEKREEAEERAAEKKEEAEEAREASESRGLANVLKNSGAFDLTDAAQGPASPAPNLVFEPGIEGVDPMIAVGKQFMLVSQQGAVGFFDKSGNRLPTKWGAPTLVSTSQLFSPLWQPMLNGVVNRNNINLHLRFPLSTSPEMKCDATAASPAKPCVQEMYDTRIAYDRTSDRFVIVAAVRHSIWMGEMASDGTPLDPWVRRYFVVAVSRTDDPRDGFQAYINTETNYSDGPRVGLGNGILIVAHGASKDVTDWKPMAYVFAISDMALGSAEPRNWKIDPFQTNGGSLLPVTHLSSSSGWNHMVHANDISLEVFSFQNSATTFSALPPLHKTSVDLTAKVDGFSEDIVFRNDKLHFVSVTKKAERIVNLAPAQYSARLVRVPLPLDADGFPKASNVIGEGFLDFDYGGRAASDVVNQRFSYDQPSLAVNADGDILVSFGRVPINSLTPQEVRYFIFRNATSDFEGSRLLKPGTGLLTFTYPDATTFTAVPYWHVADDDNGAHYIDFANAVVDPSDDTTFWMTHEFSNGSAFKMVVGRVLP
jgi:hypothetical protein